jgi:hypothetical protein
LLNVLYIREGRAGLPAQAGGEPFFYRGEPPRILFRLRLGPASLLTAEPQAVARLAGRCHDVLVETIPVMGPAAGRQAAT